MINRFIIMSVLIIALCHMSVFVLAEDRYPLAGEVPLVFTQTNDVLLRVLNKYIHEYEKKVYQYEIFQRNIIDYKSEIYGKHQFEFSIRNNHYQIITSLGMIQVLLNGKEIDSSKSRGKEYQFDQTKWQKEPYKITLYDNISSNFLDNLTNIKISVRNECKIIIEQKYSSRTKEYLYIPGDKRLFTFNSTVVIGTNQALEGFSNFENKKIKFQILDYNIDGIFNNNDELAISYYEPNLISLGTPIIIANPKKALIFGLIPDRKNIVSYIFDLKQNNDVYYLLISPVSD